MRIHAQVTLILSALLVLLAGGGQAGAAPEAPGASTSPVIGIAEGTMTFRLDPGVLEALGWEAAARTELGSETEPAAFVFPLSSSSRIEARGWGAGQAGLMDADIRSSGALLLLAPEYRFVVSNPSLAGYADGSWLLMGFDSDATPSRHVFDVTSALIDWPAGGDRLQLVAEVAVSAALAEALGQPDAQDVILGSIIIETTLGTSDAPLPPAPEGYRGGGAIGPDVIVAGLYEMNSYGSLAGVAAFAVGTIACNAGDEPLNWYPDTNQHPVIAMSMYRLKDNRFEQIGTSWVKHGFAALTGDTCGFGCIPTNEGTDLLGVGCSDPYSANLNGSQNNMSPRSDVNVQTGYFPYPWSAPPPAPTIGRRLQVATSDLEPQLNEGAEYFVQGHYVTADDAAAGNHDNNMAYCPITVSGGSGVYTAQIDGITQREQPAIRAWKARDPSVSITAAGYGDIGKYWAASKAEDLGNGFWRYTYAIQNVTSHRSARSIRIPLPDQVAVQSAGFHDVDYHSGEPYDLTDWDVSIGNGVVEWSTQTYDFNPNANALRWGTIYTYWFDADSPPQTGLAEIGLFRPGTPTAIHAQVKVPMAPAAVCGDGFLGEGEECDPPDGIHCDGECQWICGDGDVQQGEECDPPNGTTCDANCMIIYICGDGVIDPGEECDPPNGVTCDANCQRIPICGDSIIDPGEQCDPPNGITCDESCQYIDIDSCVSAVALCPSSFDGTTVGATADGSSACDVAPDGPDVWFMYVPLIDGTLTVDTCGSAFDTVLSILTGCPGEGGAELACNDNACGAQSSVSLPVTSGVEYLIRVAGFDGAVGSFRLNVAGPPCRTGPAENDDCEFVEPAFEGTTPFTTLRGTTDGPEEPTACGAGAALIENDIWYCYVPSCTGTATLSVCDADFDTALAVYAGCTCPTAESATACNDDACSAQSELTIPVTAGASYLIRIGGHAGASGTGNLAITCTGPGNGIYGGLLWDKWWLQTGAPIPTGDHPLYPPQGTQSGSATYRCKECHGWDYKGVDGQYGSGSHATGIPGVFGSTMTPEDMFEIVRGTSVPSGHGFEALGLTHQNIWDLVEFMQTFVIDTDLYIDVDGTFLGNVAQGETLYTSGGLPSCEMCHGADGAEIDFGSASEPEWVGTVAWHNPAEMHHKTRFGHPGSPMPSWILDGGTDQEAADISLYAQVNFPVDCYQQGHCDDGLLCSGIESCDGRFCQAGPDPCPDGICDEDLPGCLSGLCDAPTVAVPGSRYISVTPPAGVDPIALKVTGDPASPEVSCVSMYVQADGSLGVDAVYQAPDSWGTIQVHDGAVQPGALYRVRADCGLPGTPDLSLGETATTWLHGDVDHNGINNFNDIMHEVQGFQGNFDWATLEALDLVPCMPNGVIDFNDINEAVRGFQGLGPACDPLCP